MEILDYHQYGRSEERVYMPGKSFRSLDNLEELQGVYESILKFAERLGVTGLRVYDAQGAGLIFPSQTESPPRSESLMINVWKGVDQDKLPSDLLAQLMANTTPKSTLKRKDRKETRYQFDEKEKNKKAALIRQVFNTVDRVGMDFSLNPKGLQVGTIRRHLESLAGASEPDKTTLSNKWVFRFVTDYDQGKDQSAYQAFLLPDFRQSGN